MHVLVPATHEGVLEAMRPEEMVVVLGCCDVPEWAYVEEAYGAVARRRRELSEVMGTEGVVDDEVVMMEGVELGPWVARKSAADGMGYLNTVRRVRKFLG